MQPMGISDRNLRFIAELFAMPKRNATEAYVRVYGVTDRPAAGRRAWELMQKPEIQQAIALQELAYVRKVEITAEQVIQDIKDITETDVNEIVEWRIGACRYCHGDGHLYQRRPSEYRRDLELYMRSHAFSDPMGLKFPMQGGAGYTFTKPPHPECPECDGMGEGKEFLKDTRYISPAALTLYNGIERTKSGVRILTRSRDKALDIAAKYAGVSKENVNINGNVQGGGVTIYVPDNGRDPPKEE